MRHSWSDERIILCRLIKQVSDAYGGDEKEWLIDYCREVIAGYRDDLETAINCFQSLVDNRKKPRAIITRKKHDDGMEPKEAGRAEGAV